jgi:hypothetical protein
MRFQVGTGQGLQEIVACRAARGLLDYSVQLMLTSPARLSL